MSIIIETGRLILREMQSSDANDIFELDSNPEVHKYLGKNPIYTIEQAENVIKLVRKQYAENVIGRWATIEKSTGKFIGWSGLKFIQEYENNQIHFYDVGYRLMPKYWGKGYATESAKSAIEYGFTKMNLNEIIGSANVDNNASKKVLEKCGLKYIEQFIWHNIKCDWFKITKVEWISKQM